MGILDDEEPKTMIALDKRVKKRDKVAEEAAQKAKKQLKHNEIQGIKKEYIHSNAKKPTK